jgi:glycosyltransferase involved in cell wall biosynthesis
MFSVIVFPAPGLDDYTFHFVNALSAFARVGYIIDAKQRDRFGNALSSAITPIVFHRPRRRHLWGAGEMYKLSRAIKHFHPDIFHLQGDGLWESVLLRLLGDIPVINTVHDPVKHIDYQNILNNTFLQDAIRRAKGWVVHSEGLKRILIREYRLNSDRVLVHPLGIHDYYCRFSTDVNSPREKYILFFGEPRFNKGFDLLLKAFSSIKDRIDDWKIVAAGKGNFISGIEKYIDPPGSRIFFENRYITDTEVATLFSRAGIVALPYRHASQSGVLGIAAAFGCPVLATPVGNMSEIMEHGKNVFFVKPNDEQSLAEGLITMAQSEGLRARLGNNLKGLASSQWSWDDIARVSVDFYSRML